MKESACNPQIRELLESYQAALGEPLVDCKGDVTSKVWNLNFPLIMHDNTIDPKFNYANKAAQNLFEYEENEILGLPSRLSAPADQQKARKVIMEKLKKDSFITNYSGTRVTKTGKLFQIVNATIWNTYNQDRIFSGQAALILSFKTHSPSKN